MTNLSAVEALERLKTGNKNYLVSGAFSGNVSAQIREKTYKNGQHPFAAVVACSDSRVIPEAIFGCGIGELFVIRVAGNIVAETQLGSLEYAAEHLGCRLVVILGHDDCGAIEAALHGESEGHVGVLTSAIKEAINGETRPETACLLNVKKGVEIAANALHGTKVVGAVYHTATGYVDFID